MAVTAQQVIDSRLGRVIAPAGCGKTELIVQTLGLHSGKPALVLTHTNAGVVALRQRILSAGVSNKKFRLATIDGWIMHMALTYPELSGAPTDNAIDINYHAFRLAASRMLHSGAIDDQLLATYGRVLVDEYQDTSSQQHNLILGLARRIPTCVFADSLQAIFNFNDDPQTPWDLIEDAYPLLGELDIPWRWRNANSEQLGQWLLNLRNLLEERRVVNLTSCPAHIAWHRLSGNHNTDRIMLNQVRNGIARAANERLIIVGNAMAPVTRHSYAKGNPGVSVIEPVELGDMLSYARRIDGVHGRPLLDITLDFAGDVMTGVNSALLLNRLNVIAGGRSRSESSDVELAAMKVLNNGGITEAGEFLRELYKSNGTRIFRPRLFSALIEAINGVNASIDRNILRSAELVREHRRHTGRRLPSQGVGSTLLVKGLECEHVLILDADRMDARNLYVAMSRGSRTVTVLSRQPTLNPV